MEEYTTTNEFSESDYERSRIRRTLYYKGTDSTTLLVRRILSLKAKLGLTRSQVLAVVGVKKRKSSFRLTISENKNYVNLHKVSVLETFCSLTGGHSKYIGKIAFGRLGYNKLAKILVSPVINEKELYSCYSTNYLSLHGMYKRGLLARATKEFT